MLRYIKRRRVLRTINPSRAEHLDNQLPAKERRSTLKGSINGYRNSKRSGHRNALDVEHFMQTVGVRSREELRTVDHKAVIAWERYMREVEGAQSSTIRRRLAALSSLFRHLVSYGHATKDLPSPSQRHMHERSLMLPPLIRSKD